MMNKLSIISILLNFLITANLYPQINFSLGDKLPIDSSVTIGKLENGLTYYLRYNKKPEKRVFLRLVLNAGSILEDENQLGLAHFVEHMAFNGTKSFAKNEIINYLESIGMRFGADVNASTSFDETVYMLEVPTDSLTTVVKGIQILKEWASAVSFDSAEVEKERGVIIEEWRLGRGAEARIFDKQVPILFKNSRYAERLPIGKKEIIESFNHSALKKYYEDWYRPDLMAVIAVGDIDKAWLEQNIKQIFSEIPKPGVKADRIIYPIPDHDEVLFSINSDLELQQSVVSLYRKFPVQQIENVGDYRKSLVENLYNGMLNARFAELTQKPEPPFLYGYSTRGNFIRSKSFYVLAAAAKEDSILVALNSLLTEAERVHQTGFTKAELSRQKAELLRGYERRFNEKEKTNSNNFMGQYSAHFLTSNPIPGIEYEFNLAQSVLPDITLDEINNLAEKLNTDKNYVVLVSAPEKENLKLPLENDLKQVISEVQKRKLTVYKDEMPDASLIDAKLNPVEIVDEEKVDKLGITKLELENGVKVILKPTDFKKDEIIFRAFSDGGTSLFRDEDYIPASTAVSVVVQGGVGKFNLIELQKYLKGKIVNVSPYIGELGEGISGSVSPKDIETMFQLIYLNFHSPRLDSNSFLSYKTKLENFLKNKDKDPESAFRDTIGSILSQYHPRRTPWTTETLSKLDPEKSFNVYKDRFADASDFTFVFVGSFDTDSIKPFIQTYLGNLPSIKRKEVWKDIGVTMPNGIIQRDVFKGIENKSLVSISFPGEFDWDVWEVHKFSAMTDVLKIKLREIIREEMSGTYGVNVGQMLQKYPDETYMTTITFGCDPVRVDELVNGIFEQIDSLKKFPVDESYIAKVKETQRREWEVNLKENNFWLNRIYLFSMYDYDLEDFYDYAERIDKINAEVIRESFSKYFNKENYIKVVLKPEQKN